MLVSQGAAKATAPPSPQDDHQIAQFQEVVMVCTGMDMYANFAAYYRDQGMPVDAATNMIVASVQKNMKLPNDMLPPFISVVKDLYQRIYVDPSLKRGMFDEAIFNSCSNFGGYQIDKKQLRTELSNYVQSAFDPLKRVSVCTKAGETAANIGAAREKGINKSQILDMARKGLQNDPTTLALLPTLVEEVYDNKDIEIASFYLYNLRRCESQKAGLKFPDLTELGEATKNCQKDPDKTVRSECLSKLFTRYIPKTQ
jgi:hypothetical protein